MTAKEYLSQAYWLDRRINSKLEQLSSLNDIATRSTSVISDDVVSRTRNVHAMEDVIAKIVDMKAEVNAEIDRLVDLKRDIMEVVKAVDDPELQTLLELRYLCFKDWPDTGKAPPGVSLRGSLDPVLLSLSYHKGPTGKQWNSL